MEQLLTEDVLPGVVVFGRVTSFPWWPAIVGRCPTTGEWSDSQERRWVFFFNDNSGAWLKIRDMRPFTEWTRETMAEINTTNPKYRRHLQSIAGACVLAEEYMRAPVIPRTLSEYNASLTYAALDMDPPAQLDAADAETMQPPGSSVGVGGEESAGQNGSTQGEIGSTQGGASGSNSTSLRKRRRRASVQTGQNPELVSPGSGQNVKQSGGNSDQRPRRRRKKSIRYQGFDDPFKINARNGKLKEVQEAAGNAEESAQQGKEKASQIFLTLPLRGSKDFANISQWKMGGSTTANVNASTPGTDQKEPEKPIGKAVTVNKNNRLILRINGVAVPRSQNPVSSPPRATDQLVQTVRAGSIQLPMRQANGIINPRRKDSLSTDSSSDEEEVDAKFAPNGLHVQSSQNAVSPSRAPWPGAGDDTASSSTESESKADQEHVAAEHADVSTGGMQGPSTGELPEDAKQDGPATTTPEALYELLNRLSSLEGHVQSLQMRVGPDDGVIAGEDTSAAALKAAVQNLVKAAQGFARSRDFERGAVSVGVDALWPEPEAGSEGADSVDAARRRDCARAIAKELVWAAGENMVRR